MLITLSRRAVICQSVAEVQLTGVARLETVIHTFNLILIRAKLLQAMRTYRHVEKCLLETFKERACRFPNVENLGHVKQIRFLSCSQTERPYNNCAQAKWSFLSSMDTNVQVNIPQYGKEWGILQRIIGFCASLHLSLVLLHSFARYSHIYITNSMTHETKRFNVTQELSNNAYSQLNQNCQVDIYFFFN